MAFINGIGIISPQNTLDKNVFLEPVVEHSTEFMKCIEPVYKEYIDPIQSRRMSRLIKMGITSAKICMSDSGCSMPDAIITGTGLGSVEDTEKILGNISREEKFLNPTPFIQSTYNTMSSQIAINLKCHGYNSTYVHRTFSFESVLLDAEMQIREGMAANVLAGGIDEMTLNHLHITARTGLWKQEKVGNLNLLNSGTTGSYAGEGSGYFLLSSSRNKNTDAQLKDVATLYRPAGEEETIGFTKRFLEKNGLASTDIDLVLLGLNGDVTFDPVYRTYADSIFPTISHAYFKHLCGEYHTATAFAFYLAAQMLRRQACPGILLVNGIHPEKLRNILIYNHFRNVNHSLILVSA